MPIVTTSSGKKFEIQSGETLLAGAMRHDIRFGYSCRTGRCSSCKGKVRQGETSASADELGLSKAEIEAGWVLTCVRHAASDVDIEIEDLSDWPSPPVQTLPCRIQSLERMSTDVIKVLLRLPPSSNFNYRPGQYIDVIGNNGIRRSYSIANAPGTDKLLELHIREVEGGAMSKYWFTEAKTKDLLRLNGPLGTFFLRDSAGKDLIFLATGTGIAPVKAILEQLPMLGDELKPRSVSLYWGGRIPSDIYLHPSVLANVTRFTPVLSRADRTWPGTRGHVQDALLADSPQFDQALVYACGSEAMIQTARERLIAAGLPDSAFHADAFVCSANS